MTAAGRGVAVRETAIPGCYEVDLVVHADERGWFKENYSAQAAQAAGLPPLAFVQHNVAYNGPAGVLRGIHAEPWDKYVSVATGRAFAAIVDLRAGAGFGRVHTVELTPERALLIPEGCGNSYQTLEPATAYTYLVTAHWTPGVPYVGVDAYDPALGIDWPVAPANLSPKDRANPPLSAIEPMVVRRPDGGGANR